MDAGKLDMFRNGVLYDLAVLCHRVEFNLFGILQKFRHNYGVFFRYLSRDIQKFDHLLFCVADIHSRTTQHIRGADQNGEACFADECIDLVHAA